jgi:hypothetical protein
VEGFVPSKKLDRCSYPPEENAGSILGFSVCVFGGESAGQHYLISTFALGVVERLVGLLQQQIRIFTILGIDRDADGDGEIASVVSHADRLLLSAV